MKNKDVKTCEGCNGKCCRYVALEIDTPEDEEDFENIRWYVSHKNVNVFVDEDDVWHIEFITPCEYLNNKGMCENYEDRPHICREYDQDECPFHNDYQEKHTFTCLKEIDEYIQENLK